MTKLFHGMSGGAAMWHYAWREMLRRKDRSAAVIAGHGLAVATFSVLISLLQYVRHLTLDKEMFGSLTVLISIFIVLNIIRNNYASLIERGREIAAIHSKDWSRKTTLALIGWELTLESVIGSLLGYNAALVCQIFIPIRFSSCHLLCAIDFLKISSIGVAITVVVAIGSGLAMAWFVITTPLNEKKND